MRRILAAAWSFCVLLAPGIVDALDVNTTAQIKTSAGAIANQLVNLYPVTDPELWWEGAQIYGALVDYWAKTGDETYVALIAREIALQAGSTPPYFQLANVQDGITNYGQARWALTAMLAEEVGFVRDPALAIGYLELAEAVFNQLASRWYTPTCGGGLNTTIALSEDPSKDIFSVGEFFQLASRLAIKTKNGAYTEWASRIWDWMTTVGLVNTDSTWDVYNSVDPRGNCTNIDRSIWSINAGELLYGTALMYNLTYAQTWVTRTASMLQYVNQTFFSNHVVTEPSCRIFNCTPGQQTYRAVLVKFMAKTGQAAPYTSANIQWTLAQNGRAIAARCSDVFSGNSTCTIDGRTGIGPQLTGLNSVVSLLVGRGNDDNQPSSESSSASTESNAPSIAFLWPMLTLTVVLTYGAFDWL